MDIDIAVWNYCDQFTSFFGLETIQKSEWEPQSLVTFETSIFKKLMKLTSGMVDWGGEGRSSGNAKGNEKSTDHCYCCFYS